ncbi:hypothetical protein [Streptomyces mexicanus]|uniref:hypothetical protein n=1 Tax=Streptomyces mexicanus TaxID=178566 RepID=UPI0036699163
MAVRTVNAAAALAAAVAVYALVQRARWRRARRDAAAERLMAGCVLRDNAVLRRDLEVFRRRLAPLLAQQAVVAAACLVLEDVLHPATDRIDPSQEGGTR